MKKYVSVIGLFLLTVCLFACKLEEEPSTEAETEREEISYVYEDTAILVSMDTGERSITFQNVETGLRYTLEYDGATFFYNEYGTAMSAEQMVCGVVADISFHKTDKKLLSLQKSSEYFVYKDIAFEEFIKRDSRIAFLGEEYKLDDFLVISDGNLTMDKMELSKGDVISICGNDHTIYGIYLQSGHGYLRLENDAYFVGGWIEVGNKIIRAVTEDMLLTVPEGTYDVLISNDGISGEKSVTIGRNQEVTLDLGDIDVEKKYGNVLFILSPSDAQLYVDGEKKDTSVPVSMEYGIHQLICRADNYDTMSSYIKVGEPSASISLTLTPSDEEDADEDDSESTSDSSSESSSGSTSGSSESSSGNSENTSGSSSENNSQNNSGGEGNVSSGTASTSAKIYLDGPEGTEIYVDGTYVGIAPLSFNKPEGSVVITLRKTGFQTRSYTIQLEDDDKDVHYSFSELTAIGS